MNRTTEKILAAAAQLFSTGGFRGTSIREIAALSGVNDITVFRHFPQKEELFWSALESKLIEIDLRSRLHSSARQAEDPHETARKLANTVLASFLQNSELSRLLYVSVLELNPVPPRVQLYLRPILFLIADRLCQRGPEEVLRKVNSEQAALALAAVALSHTFIAGLFGSTAAQEMTARDAIDGYCDIWLHGVVKETALTSPKCSSAKE
jgi:AcrR family transcriptional regulator